MATSPSLARRNAPGALACACLLLAAAARAELPLGESLPGFVVEDINGRAHGSHELRGRPTLLLAMTDGAADATMRAWGDAAAQRLTPGVRKVQIVSLDLPGVVPTEMLRAIARARAPERVWRYTWLDRDGALRGPLGLTESPLPWAFALDAGGRVVARAHSAPDAPEARAVWEALR
ncbi:MAG: hypothetical protein U0325_00530 [Polyangiales bacterium]